MRTVLIILAIVTTHGFQQQSPNPEEVHKIYELLINKLHSHRKKNCLLFDTFQKENFIFQKISHRIKVLDILIVKKNITTDF